VGRRRPDMTVKHRKALATILERLAEPGYETETIFLFDEANRWPAGAVSSLVASKLLKVALPAETITCRGCEERCHRPITWIGEPSDSDSRAISTCHLLANMGPFEQAPEQLKRWASSRELVVRFVGSAIDLKVRSHDDRWRRVQFGTLELDGNRRPFSIEFDGAAKACIGMSKVPLDDLFEWTSNSYRIDRDALKLLVIQSGDLQLGNKSYQPSIAMREENKLANKIKIRRLQRHMVELSLKHPSLSKDQLAKRLARSPDGEGMTAATIARVTRKPRKKSGRKSFA
jgi:hypothetical protein